MTREVRKFVNIINENYNHQEVDEGLGDAWKAVKKATGKVWNFAGDRKFKKEAAKQMAIAYEKAFPQIKKKIQVWGKSLDKDKNEKGFGEKSMKAFLTKVLQWDSRDIAKFKKVHSFAESTVEGGEPLNEFLGGGAINKMIKNIAAYDVALKADKDEDGIIDDTDSRAPDEDSDDRKEKLFNKLKKLYNTDDGTLNKIVDKLIDG